MNTANNNNQGNDMYNLESEMLPGIHTQIENKSTRAS